MAFQLGMDEALSPAMDLIQVDRSSGLKALQALAERGNKSAIVHLGLYLSEETPTTDEAVKWLRQAAEFESADAAWNLAMVERERGNPFGLRMWINRAADWGEPDAIIVKQYGYDVDRFLAERA